MLSTPWLAAMEKAISPNGWEIVITIIQEIITDELSHHTQKTIMLPSFQTE
ncbi:hypothetical protein [Piscirickettsia salmonis]|uniref:hypothetical protein n=1 Tax=Piscirickettsia salmonis TaxID=1238 RepID=UPI0012B9E825|nr:hypothetical protein [Piscirickettsia salmonis]